MNLSPHHKRLLTAAALLILIAAAITCGGWALFLVLLLAALQGMYEFYSLLWPGRGRETAKAVGMALGAVLLLGAWRGQWIWVLGVILVAFWALNLRFLCRYGRQQDGAAYPDEMILLAGMLYLPGMLQFFFLFTPLEIVLVLVATIASDAGAYYAGTLLGKRKIWPVISPKKTWMGSGGGLAVCVAACVGFGLTWGAAPWWVWVLVGVALNVAAQAGDFFESALKRRQDVKDSGQLLPGHGGILDRIDSLLLVVPVYAAARTLHALF